MFSRHLGVGLLAALVAGASGCRAPQQREGAASNRSSAQSPLAGLSLDLPSFRTFDDLKEYGNPRDETEKFYSFEENERKIALIIRTWGSGSHWNVIIIYAFDPVSQHWVPRAFWNPETAGVYATFNKRSGKVELYSKTSVLIFRTSIAALVPPVI